MINNNSYKNSLSTFIGLFMGIYLIYFFSLNKDEIIIAEELALGKNNKKVTNTVGGNVIHCNGPEDLDLCITGYKKIGENNSVALWLGNSQLHAINEFQTGDETASVKLHRNLRKIGLHKITISTPNANLQEHYLMFANSLYKFPVKVLILPMVFDDMREDIIRPSYKEILNDEQSVERIEETVTGKNLIYKYNKKKYTINNELKVKKYTPQEQWENLLNKELVKIWPLWSERENLRASLFHTSYLLRNSIFNINSTTTRKMLRGPYINNQNAFKEILNLASKNKIEVLVYIAPIRNDVKIPYDIKEYNNFKKQTKNITNKNGVPFVSLENIVPSKFWGYTNSTNIKKKKEIDFMHFKAEGHSLLADSLLIEIRKILE
jgi:hypothetical protein